MKTRLELHNDLQKNNTNTLRCNALSDAYISGDFDLVELLKCHSSWNNAPIIAELHKFMDIIPNTLSNDESCDGVSGDYIARRFIHQIFELDFAQWSFKELKMAFKDLLLDQISILSAYKKYTIPKTTFYRYFENIIKLSIWPTLKPVKWIEKFNLASYQDKLLIFKVIDQLVKISPGPLPYLTSDVTRIIISRTRY